jgi:dTDP-4-dehydrorhamnose reductase
MVVGKIKTVIFGAGGMLGSDLCKVFRNAVMLTHNDLDIINKKKVIEFLDENKPDIVINAAAYTDVDGCEDNQEKAFEVNGQAPGYIAEGCSRIGARLLHYSTDYIFEGNKKGYTELDLPNPINVYGKSKLIGEKNIINKIDDYQIIRTSWLFGLHGRNFVETIIGLSNKMDTVRVVNDQFGKPTYTADLARKTREIMGHPPGVYHITNEGVCSWYEFAKAIIDNIEPCTSEEFIRKAKRPKYSVLLNTKTSSIRHWKDALNEYLILRKNGDIT